MKNKNRVMRNMLISMIGAAICMAATWLSSAYGEGNVRNGLIQSNWPKMSFLRFEISLILMAVGIPIYYLGLKELVKAIRLARRKRSLSDLRMAKLFDMSAHIGIIGFMFVHAGYTMMAIVYKLLYTTNLMGADIISTTEGMFYYLAIPLLAFYIIGIGGVSLGFIYYVMQERLKVSKICIFFNPLVLFGIGELLKLSKVYYLADFASASVPFGFLLMMSAGLVHVSQLPNLRRKRRVERESRERIDRYDRY